jgi:hypothetical protein
VKAARGFFPTGENVYLNGNGCLEERNETNTPPHAKNNQTLASDKCRSNE